MAGITRKILKTGLSIVIVLVLFILVVTGIFLAVFDPNEYKQEMSDLVLEQTGRELEFYGDVSLTIFPALGMELGGMGFSNASGFSKKTMIKVNKASISVDVASLLAFNPSVNQLVLEDLEINLQKNKAGVTNWDDLLTPVDTPGDSSTAATSSSATEASSAGGNVKGSFGGLVIKNARLLWDDAETGVEYRIDDLDIETGEVTPDKPFALQIHMELQSKDEVEAVVDLQGNIHYQQNLNQLDIGDMSLQLKAEGELLPQGEIEAGIASKMLSLNLERGALKLEGMELSLGENQLNGVVEISDFQRPALAFNLSSEVLDIDALLGTSSADEKNQTDAVDTGTGTANPESKEDVQISLPMELLRSIQVDGKLQLNQVKVENLLLENVVVKIDADKGILDLDPIAMNLYQGSFQGSVQIDARGKLPRYLVVEKLAGVQAGPLLTDYMGEDRILGEMASNVRITTHGEWLSALKKNSKGNLDIELKNGAIKGFNLRYSIEQARAKLSGEPAPPEQPQQTDFTSLTMSGLIKQGVFSSNDLNLQAPLLRVGGEGIANINNETVDYRVDAKLVGTIDGQQGGDADELKGLLIPVTIIGPFNAPDVDVNLEDLLKANAAKLQAEKEAELKAKLEAAKEAEKKKAEDKLKDKLKKLF